MNSPSTPTSMPSGQGPALHVTSGQGRRAGGLELPVAPLTKAVKPFKMPPPPGQAPGGAGGSGAKLAYAYGVALAVHGVKLALEARDVSGWVLRNPGKTVAVGTMLGMAGAADAYRRHADNDPATADTSATRALVPAMQTGMGAGSLPIQAAFLHQLWNHSPPRVSETGHVLDTPQKHFKAEAGLSALRGALMGNMAGTAGAALLRAHDLRDPALFKDFTPDEMHDVHEYERSIKEPGYKAQFKDPSASFMKKIKLKHKTLAALMPLGGAAVGAVAAPVIKYGPMAARVAMNMYRKGQPGRVGGTQPGGEMRVDFGSPRQLGART